MDEKADIQSACVKGPYCLPINIFVFLLKLKLVCVNSIPNHITRDIRSQGIWILGNMPKQCVPVHNQLKNKDAQHCPVGQSVDGKHMVQLCGTGCGSPEDIKR